MESLRLIFLLFLALLAQPSKATDHVFADGFEMTALVTPFMVMSFSLAQDSFASESWAASNIETPGDGLYVEMHRHDLERGFDPFKTSVPDVADWGTYFGQDHLYVRSPILGSQAIVNLPVGALVVGIEVQLHVETLAYAKFGQYLETVEPQVFIDDIGFLVDLGFGVDNPRRKSSFPIQRRAIPDPFFIGPLPPPEAISFGGPNDLWGLPDVYSTRVHWTTGQLWLNMRLRNYGNWKTHVWFDAIRFRLHYLPQPPAPGARMAGSGTMSATLNSRKSAAPPLVFGEGMVKPFVSAGRNLTSRIYSGPTKGTGAMTLSLTRNTGGVLRTHLYPEPKATGTINNVAMQRGFAVQNTSVGNRLTTGAGTLIPKLGAMRRVSTPLAIGGSIVVNIIGGRPAVVASQIGAATMAVVMTSGRSIAATLQGAATMPIDLRGQFKIEAVMQAVGAMPVTLSAIRAMSSIASAAGTMSATLGVGRPLTASMNGFGLMTGDEGRVWPDLTNFFWRPSDEFVVVAPWENGIEVAPWANQVSGD